MNTQTTNGILHGECIIFQSQIPQNAVKEEPKGNFLIIAPSEVTGNHHVIDVPESGIEFFTHENKRFMKNSIPANVRCLVADRHSDVQVPAGEWEVGIQQEFDYFAMRSRNVAD